MRAAAPVAVRPATTGAEPLRVIAKPAFKNAAANPYTSLLYQAVGALGVEVAEFSKRNLRSSTWDICHLHWPEQALAGKNTPKAWFKVNTLLAALRRARRRGTKVVWTIHNLGQHEGYHPDLERAFWRRFMGQLDGVVSLSQAGLDLAWERLPELRALPSFVVPHGHYREVYPQTLSPARARRELGIAPDVTVVAHIGKLRPYKNVPQLIRVHRGLGDAGAMLLVCGSPLDSALERQIRATAGDDPNVRLNLSFVDNDALQLYLKAADLLVFPYAEILNSGSALLGLSFDRPILVPNRGAMAELRETVGDGWVQTYDGEFNAAILRRALDWARSARRGDHAPLGELDWSSLGRKTVDAYRDIIAVAG